MGIKRNFYNGGYYHVYNRGIDRRQTFNGYADVLRFLDGLYFFNQTDPIGSIWEYSYANEEKRSAPLVSIAGYNILDNHFHLILKQEQDDGVSKFLQRALGGYTKYYNEKYDRTGPLFSSPFKSVLVTSDEHLSYVEAYVHLNHLVHGLGTQGSKSSLYEFTNGHSLNQHQICNSRASKIHEFKDVVSYKKYLGNLLEKTVEVRELERGRRKKSALGTLLLD